MDFRCPYCGEKVFSLRLKLGINTKFGVNPICPKCKNVVCRGFVIGGPLLYNAMQFLPVVLCLWVIFISDVMGGILSISLLTAFCLVYNYYFCHFSRGIMIDSKKRTICIKLKEVNRIWPNIRKGEIYELLPADVREPYYEDMYTIGMVEKIQKGEICFRIIKNHSREGYAIKDNLIIFTKEKQYLAFVV